MIKKDYGRAERVIPKAIGILKFLINIYSGNYKILNG